MSWTTEHGPDELYAKFTVIRNRTGETIADEFVFVLRPESDREACHALWVYAWLVGGRSPILARQIRDRLRAIERANR